MPKCDFNKVAFFPKSTSGRLVLIHSVSYIYKKCHYIQIVCHFVKTVRQNVRDFS